MFQVSRFEHSLESAPFVVMDGNIPTETMSYICDVCSTSGVPGCSSSIYSLFSWSCWSLTSRFASVWFEPTDMHLVGKIYSENQYKKLTYVSPNYNELVALNEKITEMHPDLISSAADIELTSQIRSDLAEKLRTCSTLGL